MYSTRPPGWTTKMPSFVFVISGEFCEAVERWGENLPLENLRNAIIASTGKRNASASTTNKKPSPCPANILDSQSVVSVDGES